MNNVTLMGRLTKDPKVTYTQGEKSTCVARYTVAVDRRFKKGEADFINCVAFGKQGEFAEKYLKKGTKIAVTGRIQVARYTNKDGVNVYTTDVVIESQEFAESKKAAETEQDKPKTEDNGFMSVPDGFDDQMPFI